MEILSHANALLAKLSEQLPVDPGGSGGFELDNNNEFFLSLGDRIAVMFYLDEDINAFILNLPLGPVPATPDRERVMLNLLCANYSWNLTEGGTLGVDRETGQITLGYLLPLPMAFPGQIIRVVEKLAAVADYWIRELAVSVSETRQLPSQPLGDEFIKV